MDVSYEPQIKTYIECNIDDKFSNVLHNYTTEMGLSNRLQ